MKSVKDAMNETMSLIDLTCLTRRLHKILQVILKGDLQTFPKRQKILAGNESEMNGLNKEIELNEKKWKYIHK